jgi:hypothetical protein
MRQLVTEAVVLALLGAAGGTLLAWWITAVVASLSLPLPIPLAFDLRIDGRVLAFTLGATFFAALLAGLAPALQATKPSLIADLRGEVNPSHAAGHPWTLRDAGRRPDGDHRVAARRRRAAHAQPSRATDQRGSPSTARHRPTDTSTLQPKPERSVSTIRRSPSVAIPGVESALATRAAPAGAAKSGSGAASARRSRRHSRSDHGLAEYSGTMGV